MTIPRFHLDDTVRFSKVRQHHYLYAHKVLPALSLKRNKTFLSILADQNSNTFLADLWQQTAEHLQIEDVVPSEGLTCSPLVKVNSDYLLSVIRFPPAEKPGEAILTGIIFHRRFDETRYIVLEKSFQKVMLCEWTLDGQYRCLPESAFIAYQSQPSLKEFAGLLTTHYCRVATESRALL